MSTTSRTPAFEELLRDREWAVSLARSLVRGDHAVEDVVQQAYLRALLYLKPGTQPARAWMAMILRNVARRRGRVEQREAAFQERREGVQLDQPATVELVEQLELQRRLADQVLKLAEPYQSVVLLRYYENLTPAEIAQRLVRPIETVRTQLKRAVARLRDELDTGDTKGRDPWRVQVVGWLALLEPSGGQVAAADLSVRRVPQSSALRSASALATGVPAIASLLMLIAITLWTSVWLWTGEPDGLDFGVVSPASGMIANLDNVSAETTRLPIARSPPPQELKLAVESRNARGVRGRVVDTDHVGVMGAEVRFRDFIETQLFVGDTTTGEDGSFSLACTAYDQEPAGSSEGGWKPTIEVSTGDGAVYRRDVPRTLSELRAWDFDSPFLIPDLIVGRGVEVSGRVVSAAGSPINDATLYLLYPDALNTPMLRPVPVGTTLYDGSFVLAEKILPPREEPWRYYLAAQSPQHGFGWVELIPQPSTLTIDVPLIIRESGTLVVRVVDPQNAVIAGATVVAYLVSAPMGMGDFATLSTSFHKPLPSTAQAPLLPSRVLVCTDANGIATLTNLPMGTASPDEVDAAAPGSGVFSVCAGIPGQCHGDRDMVSVAGGQTVNVTIQVNAVPSEEVIVSGRVADSHGVGLPEAKVSVAVNTGARQDVVADAKGMYRASIPRILSDAAQCRAEAMEYAPRELDVSERLALEAEVNFILNSVRPISGRFQDEMGMPIAGVNVMALPNDTTVDQYTAPNRINDGVSVDAESDANGQFLLSNTTAGQWKLSAWVPSRLEWQDLYSFIAEGGDQDLVLTVPRRTQALTELVGHVLPPANGSRADVCAASLLPIDGSPPPELAEPTADITDAGTTVSAHIPPGSWRLWVMNAGGAQDFIDVDVSPQDAGKRIEREIVLRDSGSIVGTIVEGRSGTVRATPRGVQSLPEWSSKRRLQQGIQAVCDAEGRFQLTSVPAGTYELLYQDGMRAATGLCDVQSGAPCQVEMSSSLGVKIRFEQSPQEGAVVVEMQYGNGLSCEAYIDKQQGFDEKLVLPPGLLRWDLHSAYRSRFQPETIVRHGEAWKSAGEELVIDCVIGQ